MRIRSRSSLSRFLLPLGVLLACSSEDAGSGPPAFSGAVSNAIGGAPGTAGNSAGASTSTSTGVSPGPGSNTEQTNNPQLVGGASAAGAGGSASTSVASNTGAAAGGAAGSATMAGIAGMAGSATTAGTAGSAGSAGTGAAGGASLPPNPPPPPTGEGCDSSAFFCQNFDALPLGALTTPTAGMTPDGTVSIIDEPGRGRVLQAQATAGFNGKRGVFLNNIAPPNNSMFGRAFVRVAQFPSVGGDHWVVVETTNSGSGELARPVGGQFSRWAPGSDGPSAGDWTDWNQSNAMTVDGEWECVEWQVNGANGSNDMTLWVNGLEVQPMDRASFRLPAINELWLGWVVFQTDGQPSTYDVRFDDVVLSTQRVGCN